MAPKLDFKTFWHDARLFLAHLVLFYSKHMLFVFSSNVQLKHFLVRSSYLQRQRHNGVSSQFTGSFDVL